MNKKEKLALFLGMLSGDGCLSKSHNGAGYRNYPIDFCNTDKNKVKLFDDLFFGLFGVRGSVKSRKRLDRKEIWSFKKTSRKIADKIKDLGFPEGVKRDILRIPRMIFGGRKSEKGLFIIGVLITDGCLKKKRGIMFHSGSKLFLEDLSRLISEFTGVKKPVKEYIQREVFRSYQLYLNKNEREVILAISPHATMVLGRS